MYIDKYQSDAYVLSYRIKMHKANRTTSDNRFWKHYEQVSQSNWWKRVKKAGAEKEEGFGYMPDVWLPGRLNHLFFFNNAAKPSMFGFGILGAAATICTYSPKKMRNKYTNVLFYHVMIDNEKWAMRVYRGRSRTRSTIVAAVAIYLILYFKKQTKEKTFRFN